ncbi:MAG: biotin transporter BioY [Anaerolineae bacterium]|nr:biotin transporter BioY [Anaerolineae bacterium]
MLRTFSQTRAAQPGYRLVSIGAFTLLTVIAARVTIPMEPVPFTLQPLAVLLAGLILGARGGGLSQLAYLALIALNLPVDARGLGAAALVGPTAGYLYGFAAGAFVAGLLVERGAARMAQRWLAGVAGIAVIYLVGAAMLKINTGIAWDAVWTAGVAPFIIPDLAKALIAAGLAEGGRSLLLRRF